MTDSAFVSTLTPQQRLENTRNALVRHMRRGEERDPSRLAEERESPDDLPRPGEGKWNAFKRAMRAWWHHHPANVALDVARPLLGEYTKGHPLKVLGIAA
ncbi:MAG: hypothetical protein JWQ72_3902, partial [Polaromonas sp.]|nr:hypothetical protein [Polaromonas sp.]